MYYLKKRGIEVLFGCLDGKDVNIHELTNGPYSVGLSELGAGISFFRCPDRGGRTSNVVLGYESPGALMGSTAYFGLTVGRYANRIAGGRFSIDGKVCQLALNDGKNHLHGGPTGLSFQIWKATKLDCGGDPGLKFSISDPAGHGNYPGNLDVEVTYILKADGSLVINYRARCDEKCPVCLCNHAYFNLMGEESRAVILGHELQLACSRYVPVGGDLIPTGKVLDVEGTPFDFTSLKPIGRDFEAAGGYDHCFVLDESAGNALKPVAFVREETTGRTLKVFSTMPAVQFYTGNFLHNEDFYPDHTGFCLETEFYPDSPNHAAFPNCVLEPGKIYDQTTIYQFGVENQEASR